MRNGENVKEKLITESYLECMIKTAVFTSTILIEMICGFSSTDIRPFYLTVLLQAINNMYEVGGSIAKGPKKFTLNMLQGGVFLSSVVDLILAICFMANVELEKYASNIVIKRIVFVLTASILMLFCREITLHLKLIKEKEKAVAEENTLDKENIQLEQGYDDAIHWDDI